MEAKTIRVRDYKTGKSIDVPINRISYLHPDEAKDYRVEDYFPKEQEALKPTADPVNHPSHYNKLSMEVIDILEEITPHYPPSIIGHIWNVLKYLFRAPFKGKMLQDMKKAKFYLDKAIAILEKNEVKKGE